MPLLPAVPAHRAAVPQFLKTPIKIDRQKGAVTIVLPKGALEGLGLGREVDVTDLYWIVTNGVVQLSAHQPSLSIPPISPKEEDFHRQGAGD